MAKATEIFTISLLFSMVASPCGGAIMIVDGPSNTTAFAGNPVTFRCRFTGTRDLPQWDIGRTVYSSSALPPGFHYSIIQQVHVGGGNLSRIESPPAYLVVYSCCDNGSDNQPPTSNTPTNIGLSGNVTNTNCTMETGQCRKSASTDTLISRELCIIVTLIAVASILCTTGLFIALIKWKQIRREAKALRSNGSDLMQIKVMSRYV